MAVRVLGLARGVHQPEAQIGREIRQRDVFCDRNVEQQTRALTVLRNQINPMLDCRSRCSNADRFAIELDRTAAERIDPEYGPGKLRAPGADEPRETEDLARRTDRLTARSG